MGANLTNGGGTVSLSTFGFSGVSPSNVFALGNGGIVESIIAGNVTVVPFEFSPVLGLGVLAGLYGLKKLRQFRR